MFTLAHLSDPHLASIPRPRLHELAGKRALGFANWRFKRQREHRPEVLNALVTDLLAQQADHIAVTGDLVNVALPGEFEGGAQFLTRLGRPEHVTLVPGNHDAYVRAAIGYGRRHWAEQMRGDDVAPVSAASFPFVRRRGSVALIGLSTAVPTGPFMAWGRLGEDQLERTGAVLDELAAQGMFRVVLMHHPPIAVEGDRFKRLQDTNPFRRTLQRHGAELILHGHYHVHSVAWIDGPHAPIPVVGVPSASAVGHHDDRAGYNLYRIKRGEAGWRCQMVSRGLVGEGLVFDEVGRRSLETDHADAAARQ